MAAPKISWVMIPVKNPILQFTPQKLNACKIVRTSGSVAQTINGFIPGYCT